MAFAHFYRHFIFNFSLIDVPLIALTSSKKHFNWTDAAQLAFDKLKQLFTTAPILITPDPGRQFIVEVDTSDVAVGTVLYQRSPIDEKVHLCAYFSHRLSPAKHNYDISSRKLLTIRLALGEWRHRLEFSSVLFIVWMDHRNLEYIRTAKRLHFFGGFNFTISYWPGSKNTKPDSLSCQFGTSESASSTETIIPEGCVVGDVTWGIERQVKAALTNVSVPHQCP